MKNRHIRRDKKRRKLVQKYELRRLFLKQFIRMEDSMPFEARMRAVWSLHDLPKDSSKTRIRNRCVITGRPRGVYRMFKMSRITFRELASNGLIPGVTKSSW